MLVSDGLSDPFDDLQADANVNGWGLEFFIETPAAELGASPAEIKASWQFQLLYTVCSLAAGHGGIRHIIDDMQLLSTEAEGVSEAVPQDHKKTHVNKAARVGALLGLIAQPEAIGCEFLVTAANIPRIEKKTNRKRMKRNCAAAAQRPTGN